MFEDAVAVGVAQMEGESRVPFPIYKLEFIVSYCRKHILNGSEANNFTKADITKPEVVQRLYVRTLQYIFDARPDCFCMMTGDENMPYPQLIENCVPILNLYICMHSLISLCAIPNFTMNDFWNPKKKRTIMILSGIISFLQLRRRALDTYLNQQKSFKLNLEMMQQMFSSIEEMKYKIQSLNTVPPEQKAKIDVLSADITELHQVINGEYRHKQSSVQDVTTQLKAKIAERNKVLSQLKVDLINEKEMQAKLKPMIVECPEQEKSEIQAMNETVEKKKDALQKKNERILELQDKSANFTNFQKKELESYLGILVQNQTGCNQMSSKNTEIWNEGNELDRKKVELESMQTEETPLKRLLCSKLEKQDKLKMQMLKKQEARDHDLDSVATECDQQKVRNQEISEQVAQVNSERQHVLAKVQLLQENCEKDVSEYKNLLSKLLTHMEQYHEHLATVTEKATHERREQMTELKRAINERI
ncbi:kinetochore protein Nuf2 isoform X1 [Mobula hypostoma]|uniref:kinetochore protein Nuf2 isoform X1 n=2 Tax=Mobula hypostoma TaxID=723540 RepID=UPI002FC315DE